MSGHEKRVATVVFSPCNKKVASGSWDKTVRLWDSVTGEVLFVLEDYTGSVNTVKFTPDGRLLAACGTDGTIRIWDAETGAPGDVWELGYGTVACMEFSPPDGQQVVTGHLDGNLRLWNAVSGLPGPVLRGHTDMVVQVRFSPDGQLIASGSADSTVRLWDSSLCTLISLYSTSRPVFDVSFSSDGLTLALADTCNKVRLWDGSSNGSSVGQPGHSYSVESVAYLPTGQSILSGGLDKTARQWDTLTGALESTHVLTGLSIEVIFLHKLSPNLQQSASCFDETIQLLDFQTGVVDFVLEGHTKGVETFAYSQCCRWIASTSKDRSVRLWDLHNGGQGHVLSETDAESDAALDDEEPDAESDVDEPDAESEEDEPDAESEEDEPSPMALTFTSTGLRLAVGFDDGTVKIYDTQSKELLTTTTTENKGVSALAYSPNDQELAIGCFDGVAVFWHPELEVPGNTLHFGTAAVNCITHSPWKDWLTFGGYDMRVHLCQRHQSQSESSDMEALWCVVSVVEGFLDWVWDVAWNPVVRNEFVTGCMDRSVRVWRILESDDGGDGSVSVELVWGSSIGMLGAVGMRLDGVVGLDAGNLKLLRQRGAIGEFSAFEKDEADVGSGSVLDFSYGEGWNDISNDGSLTGMDEQEEDEAVAKE
ncbi:hypothetical protein BGZ88_012426 [Linnemannia elongata]|nr:hypothetical protein BGZ88_012426 [Linnemannia elongata]